MVNHDKYSCQNVKIGPFVEISNDPLWYIYKVRIIAIQFNSMQFNSMQFNAMTSLMHQADFRFLLLLFQCLQIVALEFRMFWVIIVCC